MKGVRTVLEYRAVRADCRDCSKAWEGSNALGVAARHAAAWGHNVGATSYVSLTFVASGPRRVPADHKERGQRQVDDGAGAS